MPVSISRERLDTRRGLPLPHAARAAASTLKKVCRRLGVARWD